MSQLYHRMVVRDTFQFTNRQATRLSSPSSISLKFVFTCVVLMDRVLSRSAPDGDGVEMGDPRHRLLDLS
jgi:hypothetical protein